MTTAGANWITLIVAVEVGVAVGTGLTGHAAGVGDAVAVADAVAARSTRSERAQKSSIAQRTIERRFTTITTTAFKKRRKPTPAYATLTGFGRGMLLPVFSHERRWFVSPGSSQYWAGLAWRSPMMAKDLKPD